MKYAFFSIVLAIALFDTAMFGISFGTAALLFILLKMQADSAAARFLKMEVNKYLNNENQKVEPVDYFAEIKIPKDLVGAAPEVDLAEEKTAEILVTNRPEKMRPTLQIVPQFHAPKFKGKPHEILGIEEDASEEVIQNAFRHWIKRYHPDHFGAQSGNKSADEKARKLTEAKIFMLKSKRKKKTPKAA